MKSPHEEYYNEKNDKRFIQFRTSMIGIVIMCISVGLFTLGYFTALLHSVEQPIKKNPCMGYTVLDQERVIWCNGDTVVYDWPSKIRIKNYK